MAECASSQKAWGRSLGNALPVLLALVGLCVGSEAALAQRELDPRVADQASGMLKRADALAAKGDLDDAVGRYTSVATRYPGTEIAATALWQIYRLQISRSNPSGAFEALDRLASGQSGHFEKAQSEQLRLVKRLMGEADGERRSLDERHPSEVTKPAVIETMLKRIIQLGPYSESGIHAEFLLALSKERGGEADEAADMHEKFLEKHADHEMADDAAYQVAYIRYKRWKSMRGESPRYREAAAVALAYFLARFPDSAKAAQAQSCLSDLRASEFKELMGLVSYYEAEEQPEAAAVYYREMGSRFPEVVARSPELQKKVRQSIQILKESGDTPSPPDVGPGRSDAGR